jgi:hypothetical protein
MAQTVDYRKRRDCRILFRATCGKTDRGRIVFGDSQGM